MYNRGMYEACTKTQGALPVGPLSILIMFGMVLKLCAILSGVAGIPTTPVAAGYVAFQMMYIGYWFMEYIAQQRDEFLTGAMLFVILFLFF